MSEQEDILQNHIYDVRMFSHHIQYNTTAAAANAITTTLNGNLCKPLQSLFKTERLVEKLSDLKTNTIHMCINSCCTFNGPFADWDHCPFCKHPWRNRKGIPYKVFRPIPLAPCLQVLYVNPGMAKAMHYRTNYHEESEAPSPQHLGISPPCPNVLPSSGGSWT